MEQRTFLMIFYFHEVKISKIFRFNKEKYYQFLQVFFVDNK